MENSMPVRALGAFLAMVLGPAMAAAASSPACPARMSPADAVRCALATNPDVRIARRELDVVAGRRYTAGTTLPSFPQIDLLGAGRSTVGDSAFNTYVLLKQEFEIAGQKSARLDEVDAEAAAQLRRVAAAENDAAARTLSAYFDVIAAEKRVETGRLLARIGDDLATFARVRVAGELLSEVDGRATESEALQLRALAVGAERDLAVARVAFQHSFGDDAPEGASPSAELAALGAPFSLGALVERALTVRGEIAAAEQESRMFEARATLFDRLGVPNVTFQLVMQRDGFRENVFGAGMSIPIRLPGNIGPSRKGEAQEARAAQAQSLVTTEGVRRRVRLEVARAHADLVARTATVALYAPAAIEAARRDLEALRDQVVAGRVPVRDALVLQRSFVDLLEKDIEARHALALASVELVRAAALPWPGAQP